MHLVAMTCCFECLLGLRVESVQIAGVGGIFIKFRYLDGFEGSRRPNKIQELYFITIYFKTYSNQV